LEEAVAPWTQEIRAWLKDLSLSPTREAEVVEELAQHVEDRYQEMLAEGLTESEASHAALAEVRQIDLLRGLERVERRTLGTPVLGSGDQRNPIINIWQDFRYAMRISVRHRRVTVVAIVTMAVGIGVATMMFSTLDLLLFRPFPFDNQQRLLVIWEKQIESDRRSLVAPGNFNDWLEQSKAFERLVAFRSHAFDLSESGDIERLMGNQVTAGFFEALGAKASLGRTLIANENEPGKNHVVVLKYNLWQSHFGSDPQVVGRVIQLNGQSFTVVGVMPRDFDFPLGGGELWTPLAFNSEERIDRAAHSLQVIGLLRVGESQDKADADLAAIALRAQQNYPTTNLGRGVRVLPLIQYATRGTRVAAPLMFTSVLLVLLTVCANVANLLLVRVASQQRDIAIRLALGASRFRAMRQILVEGVLLSILGGAFGLLVAVWAIEASRRALSGLSTVIPGVERMAIDPIALIFTLVLSVLTGLMCGLFPALTATKVNINKALKQGGRSATERTGQIPRKILVISQVAMSVALISSAAVMLKSFAKVMNENLGLRPENVLTMQVSLNDERYGTKRAKIDFFQTLLMRLEAVPGVVKVAAVESLPLGYTSHRRACTRVGDPVFSPEKPLSNWRVTTPGYFEAIGTPLRHGRTFTAQDREGAPRVALVNEAFARQIMMNRETLGHRFTCDDDSTYEIVGIVGDVLNEDLYERGEPEIYVPYAQEPSSTVYLVIRAGSNPAALTDAVRHQVNFIDRAAPISNIKSMEELVNERSSPKRLVVYGLGGAAFIALVLAVVAVYSLVSHCVSQRTHEIGLRIALGAQASNVLKLVISRGMRLVIIGCTLGLIGAWVLTGLLSKSMFGVSAHDPLVLAVIFILLIVVALIACYLPARRAARMDPLRALRHD
jgi:putative ABC transport system permease protein